MALVYSATCTVSGKSYVGLTKGSLEERKWGHISAARTGKRNCRAFHAALALHGGEAFVWSVLKAGLTLPEAEEAERLLIEELGTLAPGGYNLTAGGNAAKLSPESLARRKASQQTAEYREKQASAKRGKVLSETSRSKLSDRLKAYCALNPKSREKRGPRKKEHIRYGSTSLSPAQVVLAKALLVAGSSMRDIAGWLGVSTAPVVRASRGLGRTGSNRHTVFLWQARS